MRGTEHNNEVDLNYVFSKLRTILRARYTNRKSKKNLSSIFVVDDSCQISLSNYIKYLYVHDRDSRIPAVYIMTLMLIQHYFTVTQQLVTSQQTRLIRPLFATAYLISKKIIFDELPTNYWHASLFGFERKWVNYLELRFLEDIGFQIPFPGARFDVECQAYRRDCFPERVSLRHTLFGRENVRDSSHVNSSASIVRTFN